MRHILKHPIHSILFTYTIVYSLCSLNMHTNYLQNKLGKLKKIVFYLLQAKKKMCDWYSTQAQENQVQYFKLLYKNMVIFTWVSTHFQVFIQSKYNTLQIELILIKTINIIYIIVISFPTSFRIAYRFFKKEQVRFILNILSDYENLAYHLNVYCRTYS